MSFIKDNDILMELQKEWQERHDKRTIEKMYDRTKKVALAFINMEARRYEDIRKKYKYYERREAAHDAATYVVDNFLINDNYEIKTSFTSLIFYAVKKILFRKTKIEKVTQNITEEMEKTLENYKVKNSDGVAWAILDEDSYAQIFNKKDTQSDRK